VNENVLLKNGVARRLRRQMQVVVEFQGVEPFMIVLVKRSVGQALDYTIVGLEVPLDSLHDRGLGSPIRRLVERASRAFRAAELLHHSR